MGCVGSQESTVLNNEGFQEWSHWREAYTWMFAHLHFLFVLFCRDPEGPFQRVCVALKAKRNFSSPPSLNYRTKEIVCISFPACFQRACKCLSEWAGVTLCSFI